MHYIQSDILLGCSFVRCLSWCAQHQINISMALFILFFLYFLYFFSVGQSVFVGWSSNSFLTANNSTPCCRSTKAFVPGAVFKSLAVTCIQARTDQSPSVARCHHHSLQPTSLQLVLVMAVVIVVVMMMVITRSFHIWAHRSLQSNAERTQSERENDNNNN